MERVLWCNVEFVFVLTVFSLVHNLLGSLTVCLIVSVVEPQSV